jgi:sugar phosphate isomerase/epimerase
MELAVITDEISQDLDHALDVMAEYGIRAAEIRGAWGINIADADQALVNRIQNSCENHRVKVIGLATPFYKCDLPGFDGGSESGPTGLLHGASDHRFDEQIELLVRCIKTANALDAKLIRVFTFWKKTELTQQVEDAIVAAFREPARLAEAAGVTLIVENEHACYTGTGADTARVLSRINSPAVQAVWDPGNAIMAGEEPYPNGYDAIKHFVRHVHVKDGNRANEWTVVGQGDIDWTGQLRALKRDGYRGYLSLETHYNGGGDPETSSRQCLAGLQTLLKKI